MDGSAVTALRPSGVETLFGEEARKALRSGARKLADAVAVTLGPRGRAVCIANDYLSAEPYITKDGVTVARAFALPGAEGVGADIVRAACAKTNARVGDGTTTATLLAAEIVDAGLDALGNGTRVAALQRGIERAVGDVEAVLRSLALPVRSISQLEAVATLSANGDKSIGSLVARALTEVREEGESGGFKTEVTNSKASGCKDRQVSGDTKSLQSTKFAPVASGVVAVELGSSLHDSLEITRGYTVESAPLSPYFLRSGSELILAHPYVLISDTALKSASEVMPALLQAARDHRDLLVVAPDVSADALSSLVANAAAGAVNCCAMRGPGIGDVQLQQLGDLAAFCGADGGKDSGSAARGGKYGLGVADKVIVTRDRAILFPPAEESNPDPVIESAGPEATGTKKQSRAKRIQERVALIRSQLSDPSLSPYQREKLNSRVGRLLARIAVIRVGGATEIEARERKDRYLDALSASKAALASGYLPGGGMALLRVAEELRARRKGLPATDEEAGYQLLLSALGKVSERIVENAGEDPGKVLSVILDPLPKEIYPGLSKLGSASVASAAATVGSSARERHSTGMDQSSGNRGRDTHPRPLSFGFDASSLEFCDLVERGVIDATDVVVESLRSAASVASAILSTDALIVRT